MARRRVSERYERRIPSCWLTTGGFTMTNHFSPWGAPLRSTSENSSSVRCSANSRGLAIVADEQMKTGADP